jgi:hypothetical protein
MAEFRWKIELKKKHIIKVTWRISGNAELHLDRKNLLVEDSRTFIHSFLVDGTLCTIKFEWIEIGQPPYGKLPLWAPQLYINDKKINTS